MIKTKAGFNIVTPTYPHDAEVRDEDNIYLNIDIANNTNGVIPAKYSISRDVPIIVNSSDYYAAIVRFQIPLYLSPITICPIIPNQSNPNLTPLILGIAYNGVNYGTNVIWVYDSASTYFPTPVQNQPLQVRTPYYFSYTVTHMISLFNTALATSFNLAVAAGLPSTGGPPFFEFNATAQKISLVYSSQFANYQVPPAPNSLAIYCSSFFTTYVSSMELYFYAPDLSRGADFKTISKPLNSNAYTPYGTNPVLPPDYFFIETEYNTLTYWCSIRKIVILTSMGIRNEFLPSYVNGTATGLPTSNSILTDFVIDITDISNARGVINYFPTSQYRLIDIIKDDPITQLNLQILLEDSTQQLYPLSLVPLQQISFKIGFFNKKLYKLSGNLIEKK